MKKIILFSITVLLIMYFNSISKSNDNVDIAHSKERYVEIKRSTLQGLQGVEVFIMGASEGMEQYGITESQIRTDVELKLRQAGIKILSSEERLRTPGAPLFTVWAAIDKYPYADLFFISIQAELQQFVLLERNPAISCLATTWKTWPTGGLLPSSSLGDFRQRVSDNVDEFINDYLAANPKEQPKEKQGDK